MLLQPLGAGRVVVMLGRETEAEPWGVAKQKPAKNRKA